MTEKPNKTPAIQFVFMDFYAQTPLYCGSLVKKKKHEATRVLVVQGSSPVGLVALLCQERIGIFFLFLPDRNKNVIKRNEAIRWFNYELFQYFVYYE